VAALAGGGERAFLCGGNKQPEITGIEMHAAASFAFCEGYTEKPLIIKAFAPA